MTVARSRYIQAAALIVICGLTYMAWIHLPLSIGNCPDDATARTKQPTLSVRKKALFLLN